MSEEQFVAEYDDQAPVDKPADDKTEETVEDITIDTASSSKEESTEDEVKLSPGIERAMKDGWRPQDEWEGDPDDWVDYKEFNVRGEIMGEVKSRGKQIKALEKRLAQAEKMIQKAGEMNKAIAKKEFDRAYNALKAEKANALEEDRHDDYVEIDEKMKELKETNEAASDEKNELAEPKTDEFSVPPEVEDWLDNPANKWYSENTAMRAAADAYAQEYIGKHYGEDGKVDVNSIDWDEVLNFTEAEIRREFPQKFKSRKPRGSAVTEDSGTRVSTKGKKHSMKDVPDGEREILQTWVEQGVMTQEEALNSYFNS